MSEVSEYDLKRSLRSVRQLYPILVDAHGNVVDGFHRLKADPAWERKTLDHIETQTQLLLARIIANTHRRQISREERTEQVVELAESLIVYEKVPMEKVVSTIAELTTFNIDYVRRLLPEKYKRKYTPPAKSDLKSELETVEDLLNSYRLEEFDHPPRGIRDFIVWKLCKQFGLDEDEARRRIARHLKQRKKTKQIERGQPPKKPTTIKPDVPETTTCPLCERSGAERTLLLMKVETLSEPISEWLREELKH